MSETPVSGPPPSVSVVIPVKNESGNIGPLVDEIAAALGDRSFEVVVVDDGSRDATDAELIALQKDRPWLRHLKHVVSCGQSAALRSGVAYARAEVIATLDGDGQNDPKYLPALLGALNERSARWARGGAAPRPQGHRLQEAPIARRQRSPHDGAQ